ncbi:hypothetical protein P7K49_000300, partial [Saguinus oedipus]
YLSVFPLLLYPLDIISGTKTCRSLWGRAGEHCPRAFRSLPDGNSSALAAEASAEVRQRKTAGRSEVQPELAGDRAV